MPICRKTLNEGQDIVYSRLSLQIRIINSIYLMMKEFIVLAYRKQNLEKKH
ncbi:hypothetical protein [Chryseobacterium sp. c4a]|uniref:hypothetical protein n=1 Tax=Chryseobacterium sp. c4a TaxID=1573582 RepID=UPI0013598805|nr:hypothetical protein [Chryseobacterium sp. c4a]